MVNDELFDNQQLDAWGVKSTTTGRYSNGDLDGAMIDTFWYKCG